MIAININDNDIFDKVIGNEELKKFQYWQEIDKRIEDLKAGKGQFHELIEVDDE